jgi:hypothetical protein
MKLTQFLGLDGLGTALPDGRSGYDITKRSDEGIIETEGRSGYDITKRSVEEVLKTEGRSGYDITK